MKIIKSDLLHEVLLEKVKKEADPEGAFNVTVYDVEIDNDEVTLIYELEHKERGFVLSNKLLVGNITDAKEV